MMMTIEQIQELARQTEEKMLQLEKLIRIIESLPEDADTNQMVRALLEVQLEMMKTSRSELEDRLKSLRPALANIIIAAPAPGGRQ